MTVERGGCVEDTGSPHTSGQTGLSRHLGKVSQVTCCPPISAAQRGPHHPVTAMLLDPLSPLQPEPRGGTGKEAKLGSWALILPPRDHRQVPAQRGGYTLQTKEGKRMGARWSGSRLRGRD